MSSFVPGLFLKPMTEELQWSRGFFSTVVSLSQLASSPLAMLLWPLVDRRGARGVMIVCGLIWGVGIMALGLVQTQWHFVLVKTLIMPLGNVGVGLMMSMFVVTNWFIRKRGRVVAITAMGVSVGGIVTTPLTTYLITSIGWRHAWIVLGLMTIALNVIPAALFMRRRPEDLGLLPDGDSPGAKASREASQAKSEATWTRRQVLSTRTFWLMAFALPLGMMGMGVVNQHLVPYLTDPGINFTPQMAAWVMTTVSIAALTVKLPWGFLVERWPVRYCFALCYAFLGIGVALVVLGGANLIVLVAAAALLGMGWGGNPPLQGMLWADYFGRPSQGMARSLATPISSVASPVAPILAGFVWDLTGNYRSIFSLFTITPVVAIVLILFARRPRDPGLAHSPIER